MGEGFLQFRQSADFHLDGLGAATVADGALERRDDAAGEGDVVVLDQDSVGKIEAMILAAATADRVLVDNSQAGSGFARIENAGLRAGNRVDKFAGKGGDAAHALQKIKDHALAGKDHASVVLDYSDRLPLVQAHAVKYFVVGSHFVVRSDGAVEGGVNVKDAADAADAGENAVLFGEDGGGSALIGVDAGVAGGVAGGAVFEQGVLDDGGDAAAVKVHRTVASA